jgi:hypothetical protein
MVSRIINVILPAVIILICNHSAAHKTTTFFAGIWGLGDKFSNKIPKSPNPRRKSLLFEATAE